MSTDSRTDYGRQLESLFHGGVLGHLSDGELLSRFLAGEDSAAGAAFAVLVERHGPMVMRVCRGALGHAHDAEDAAQAVFLVLARRAGTVRRKGSAASWLHGVARRVSARARRDDARRRKHEQRKAHMTPHDTRPPADADALEELHEEIDAMPEIYRSALVLCYLEGLSHEQAAARLGCPLRTLQSRLLRAKERLRDRITRRGLAVPAVLPLPTISTSWANAAVAAARAFVEGRAALAAAGVSPASIAMARSTLRASVAVPRAIAGVLFLTGFTVAAAGFASVGTANDPPAEQPAVVAPAVEAPSKKDPNNRTLLLQVVRRGTGEPIEGAEITVETDSGARAGLGGDTSVMARLTTDRNGRCTIKFPRDLPNSVAVTARKAGYANRGYSPFDEPGRPAIPRQHTITMEPGRAIGGIVKDRAGKAVAGATVIITAGAGAINSPDWTSIPDIQVKTNADGRWHFDEMPSTWEFVFLRVTHPDFVPTFMTANLPTPSDSSLRSRRAETILEVGLPITGRVLDDRGRPIAGAKVGLGADRRIWSRDYPSVVTDAEGRFRFDHVPRGVQTVTAEAPGRSPELLDIPVEAGMKPVEFRLGPGHILRGRVGDPKGQPIDGVTVQADWKGHMSLGWSTTTNADGRFTWDSAPAEPVTLTLTRPGFAMIGQREFRAGPTETTVTMYHPLHIRGKVVDAKTGRPIDHFTVVYGQYYRFSNPDGAFRNVDWQRVGPRGEFTGGTYEIEYAHPLVTALAVRVEAAGYRSATSKPFRLDAGEVTFDARLEPGQGPSGMVLGLDGRPLAGAAVVLSTASLQAQFHNGKFHETAYSRAVTDAEGRFAFPAQTERFAVFVDHESGFAEADDRALAESKPIALRPWGRIEGTVQIGPRPAAGVEIRLEEPERSPAPRTMQSHQRTTDARGRFAFEHLIPGRLTLSRIFRLDRSAFHVGTGAVRTIEVRPGETTWVALGGTGRPVIGRFKLPAGTRSDAVFPYFNQHLAPIDAPRDALDTNVLPDGRFRIEDVAPGKYRLKAEVHEPGQSIAGSYGPKLAGIEKDVEIPAGHPVAPLDLGTIELEPVRPPGRD